MIKVPSIEIQPRPELPRLGTQKPENRSPYSPDSPPSSSDVEDIQFRGSTPPSLDSDVDTTSAPISHVNEELHTSHEVLDIPAGPAEKSKVKFKPRKFIRKSTPVPEQTFKSSNQEDTEMEIKCLGSTFKVRGSVNEIRPCFILPCCICFK